VVVGAGYPVSDCMGMRTTHCGGEMFLTLSLVGLAILLVVLTIVF
jgi:hypothetical protein